MNAVGSYRQPSANTDSDFVFRRIPTDESVGYRQPSANTDSDFVFRRIPTDESVGSRQSSANTDTDFVFRGIPTDESVGYRQSSANMDTDFVFRGIPADESPAIFSRPLARTVIAIAAGCCRGRGMHSLPTKSLNSNTGILLPNNRIAPQKMLLDLCAGQDARAKVADFAHGWIQVVVFVCLPGVALFFSRQQPAVMYQSQAHAQGDRHEV